MINIKIHLEKEVGPKTEPDQVCEAVEAVLHRFLKDLKKGGDLRAGFGQFCESVNEKSNIDYQTHLKICETPINPNGTHALCSYSGQACCCKQLHLHNNKNECSTAKA